jgi:SAM-dependent methyltransferase
VSSADRWRQELSAWVVPQEILDAAPQRPYVFSPEMFAPPPPPPPPSAGQRSRSSELAAEALDAGGSVLDVGCGGGAAAFALVPPAGRVVGADRQRDMLQLFASTARERGVAAQTVHGSWPDVAADVPAVDVVVCHNVLYNVPDLEPFASALHEHARRRVVVEVTERHPQVYRAPLWRHFWNLDRPTGPDAALAAETLRDAGFPVVQEESTPTARDDRRAAPVEAGFWCRQLCLPPEREPEVGELLAQLPFPTSRVTLWWDVAAPPRQPR